MPLAFGLVWTLDDLYPSNKIGFHLDFECFLNGFRMFFLFVFLQFCSKLLAGVKF